MAKFKIFTDSCSDLGTVARKKYDVEYVHMGIVVDGVEKIADLDWVEYTPEEFYSWLEKGKKIKTTQVSVQEFLDQFRPVLKEGFDILYIGCSSALSGSVSTCQTLVIPQLKEEFPDRTVIAVDSLLASGVEGMLVVQAAMRRAEGKSIEETAMWCEENKKYFNQFATVDTLNYLRNAGRIKGAKAFFGNLMGVKPIFISDAKGNNFVVKKAKGTKQSLEELIQGVKDTIEKEKWSEVWIGQGMARERAAAVRKRIEDELGVKCHTIWIGPIVGTTCGPGVLATFCLGKEVTRFEGDGLK